MRILVTGATGVVGRRAVPLLLQAGHQVTAAGRNPATLQPLERLGAGTIVVDLFDPTAVRRAVEGAEIIANLATAVPEAGPKMFLPGVWRQMDRVRREVSRNLVDAALAGTTVRRFIQESFAPMYAAAGDQWITETSPLQPANYNRSVLDAEASAERFSRTGSDRTGVVLRFGLFYGPNDLSTEMLIEAIQGGRFPLFGKREGFISWLAHDDAAAAIAAALGVPAGIYNAVDEPIRRGELGDGLARRLGAPAPRFMSSWTTLLGGSVARTIARSERISNHKLREASGWTPRYRTALEGLEAIVAGNSAKENENASTSDSGSGRIVRRSAPSVTGRGSGAR